MAKKTLEGKLPPITKQEEEREEELHRKFGRLSCERLYQYTLDNPECPDFHEYINTAMSNRKRNMFLELCREKKPIQEYSKRKAS